MFITINIFIDFVHYNERYRRKTIILLPRLWQMLIAVREHVKLARLCRKLTMVQVAERAGITRTTLWQIEWGAANVSLGVYAQVLLVPGLEEDLLKVAADDEMGRRIQDTQLIVKKRALNDSYRHL